MRVEKEIESRIWWLDLEGVFDNKPVIGARGVLIEKKKNPCVTPLLLCFDSFLFLLGGLKY